MCSRNFPRFMGTVFAGAHHWSPSWPRVQSTPSHTVSPTPILILSSHLHLGFKLYNQNFEVIYLSHACFVPPYFDHPQIVSGEGYRFWSSFMQINPASCHFLPFRSKYSHHPVSHQYKTMGKMIVLYLLIFKFLERRRKMKDSERNGNK